MITALQGDAIPVVLPDKRHVVARLVEGQICGLLRVAVTETRTVVDKQADIHPSGTRRTWMALTPV